MLKKYTLDFLTKIMRKSYDTEYFEIKNILNEKDLLKFEEKYLKKLLYHAYINVPYYTNLFNEIGIVKNSNIDDLSKFNKIPILTKDVIRKNYQKLVSKDYEKRRWYHNYSGGSTGEPLRFIQDIHYQKWFRATWKYYKNMIGINDNNPKNLLIWGSDRDIFNSKWAFRELVNNWLTNTKFLNSFKMNKDIMEEYIKIINSFKPIFITGYAGSLYELCRYAERKNYKLFSPKVIISAAETLRDDMRKKIENIFGTKLSDFYGSREAAGLAGEGKYGSLHIFNFNNIIEILDKNNRPVKENEEGRVIITNLHNYSMPLIRYEIGDMAVLGSKGCNCGNPLPTLKEITGRTIEHFLKENGDFIPTEFFIYLFIVYYNKGFIEKFQVIQEEYKTIRILIVPIVKMSNPDKKDIEDKIKTVMGNDVKIIWEFVDDIPKTRSGKHLYIKCEICR